jgi:hypothetical protein
MITVAKCFDIIEANRLKMILGAEGIAAFIQDEMTASAASPLFLGSGIRLQVADEHEVRARQIIEEDSANA